MRLGVGQVAAMVSWSFKAGRLTCSESCLPATSHSLGGSHRLLQILFVHAMKPPNLAIRFLLVIVTGIACGWSGVAHTQSSMQVLPKGLEAVVKQFAGSYILGTGASHFVTSIRAIDDNSAIAIVGETSDEGRDPTAYVVHAKRIDKKWKIVKYEFVFRPTGRRMVRDQTPPFPYPNWQKDAP